MNVHGHKSGLVAKAAILLCLSIFGPGRGVAGLVRADEEGEGGIAEAPAAGQVAALIPCRNMIDRGLYESIKRRTNEAIDYGATYLIYEIDTFGGDLYAADSISSYFLHEVNPKAHTVAYVSKKAISAGAMISVACKDIIMKEKTTIGDCAPIVLGGKLEGVEREKIESFTRAAFTNAAQANGYPEALLKAMVTRQLEIYSVENLETGEYEFFETEDLPKDEAKYDIENKQLVVKNDELLTVTASDATNYGIARAEVRNLQGALDFLADRDGVVFEGAPVLFKTNWSEEMVRWINSPAVMAVLVMLAMLGVYVEFNTPGLGLPGLVAVICVVIIVGSKFLVGMANWVEVAVFVIGVILLLVEIFAIPGFGIAGLTGMLCIILGVFGMLVKNAPDKLPWPRTEFDWALFTEGIIGLVGGVAGFAVLAWLLAKYLPKIDFLSGLMLAPAVSAGDTKLKTPMTAPLTEALQSVSVGNKGKVTTALRPVGSARFGDIEVDVVAQAEFLEPGEEVEIIETHGNRVVVRKVSSS
ncbi:MAG: NfeD family protein [Planctomycetota bacterium]|jgi:membrane-bound serine protease (ClpP class)